MTALFREDEPIPQLGRTSPRNCAIEDVPRFWTLCLQDPVETERRCQEQGRREMAENGRNAAWATTYLAMCLMRIDKLKGVR